MLDLIKSNILATFILSVFFVTAGKYVWPATNPEKYVSGIILISFLISFLASKVRNKHKKENQGKEE